MGANPARDLRPRSDFDIRQKAIMGNLLRLVAANAESFGIVFESKRIIELGDFSCVWDITKGVGGYEFKLRDTRMRVMIEHMGLKNYRIRYMAPGFMFPRVAKEVPCTIENIEAVLKKEWERLKP